MRPKAGNPVRIRGVIYPSQVAAARALKASKNTVQRALDEGWIDEVGLPHRRGGRPGVPCRYRGHWYQSHTAAALACGVSRAAVSKAVRVAAGAAMDGSSDRRAA